MECGIGSIETYKNNGSSNLPTLKFFYGSSPSSSLIFLNGIIVRCMAHCLHEDAIVRVVANFFEYEVERLYSSYTMNAFRLGNTRKSVVIAWSSPFQAIILSYLTYDVLSPVIDEDRTINQLTCENENASADSLKAQAYDCTAVCQMQHS